MDKDILYRIYEKKEYLEYLRYHPKWYKYLTDDRNNFKVFVNLVKKQYNITTYEKLEDVKTKFNFVQSLINYFNNN